MNSRLLIMATCVTITSVLTATSANPFGKLRDAFDEMFNQLESTTQAIWTDQKQSSFSYDESDDALTITLHGVTNQNDLKADLDGNVLTVTTPASKTKITVHDKHVAITSSSYAFDENREKESKNKKDQTYAKRESWSESSMVLPISGIIKLDEFAKAPHNLEFDEQAETLTIRLPKENTAQSLKINVVKRDKPDEKTSQRRTRKKE